MKIFLTGATGYIGNRLAHKLADNGHCVHALVRSGSASSVLQHRNIKLFEGDILRPQTLERAIANCNQVYHTAGVVKLWAKDPAVFYEHNVNGTQNVLDQAIRAGVSKFVFTSSCGVWSACRDHLLIEADPRTGAFDNDYDLSKFLAEKLVRESTSKGLFTIIVNPPRVFGPGLDRLGSGVNRFIKLLLKNRLSPIPWNLATRCNYAFIDDVVAGHLLAMERGLGGERYILGGENVSYRRLIDAITSTIRRPRILLRVPPFALQAIAQIELLRGRLNGHEPAITPKTAKRLQADKMFDCTKAIRQLGYTITPFEQGIKQTIDHIINQRS